MESLERLLSSPALAGFLDILTLVLASALPLFILWAILARVRPSFVPGPLLASAALGALSIVPALGLSLLFGLLPVSRGGESLGLGVFLWGLLRTALSEELGRLVTGSMFILLISRFEEGKPGFRAAPGSSPVFVALAAGMAFSLVETAMHVPAAPGVLFIRTLLAWPLHGFCSILVVRAVVGLRARSGPSPALLNLALSVLIHAAYNASMEMATLIIPALFSLGCFLFILTALKKGR